MTHVTGRLAAWLGGELDAAQSAALREHLAACRECRDEADRLQADWDLLGGTAVAAREVRADLWPGVRARTFCRQASGWFFGRSPLLRAALAAATLALGVLGGRLSGGLAGPRVAAAEDDGGLAAVWLEDSTWHEDAAGGLGGSWLALSGAVGSRNDDGQGGSR